MNRKPVLFFGSLLASCVAALSFGFGRTAPAAQEGFQFVAQEPGAAPLTFFWDAAAEAHANGSAGFHGFPGNPPCPGMEHKDKERGTSPPLEPHGGQFSWALAPLEAVMVCVDTDNYAAARAQGLLSGTLAATPSFLKIEGLLTGSMFATAGDDGTSCDPCGPDLLIAAAASKLIAESSSSIGFYLAPTDSPLLRHRVRLSAQLTFDATLLSSPAPTPTIALHWILVRDPEGPGAAIITVGQLPLAGGATSFTQVYLARPGKYYLGAHLPVQHAIGVSADCCEQFMHLEHDPTTSFTVLLEYEGVQ